MPLILRLNQARLFVVSTINKIEGTGVSGPLRIAKVWGWGQAKNLVTHVRVLFVDVLFGILGHEQNCDNGDDGADGDVPGDSSAGFVLTEEPGCDQGRRAARDNRGKLIAQGSAAVTHPGSELFRDERR